MSVRTLLTKLSRPLLRRYPFVRGRARIARELLAQGVIPNQIVKTRWGTRIHVLSDSMYRDVYLWGDYEPSQSRLYQSIVRPGDIVADVGANFGWYTTLLARRVGATGAVHAFEPVPTIRELARENLALNRLSSRVVLNQLGLGASAGTFVVHTFAGLPHGHASASDLGRPDAVPHDCLVDRLDAYVGRAGLRRIDFMKIDVEGFEFDVIDGAKHFLAASDAPIVAFEVNLTCLRYLGREPDAPAEALRQVGYRAFWRIDPYGGARPVQGVLPHENADYVAAKPAREALLGRAIEQGLRSSWRVAADDPALASSPRRDR